VDIEFDHRHVDLAQRLDRIAVDQPADGMDDLSGLGHRLDHTGLVVDEHEGDDWLPAIRRQRRHDGLKPGKINNAIRMHWPGIWHFGKRAYRVMLNRRNHEPGVLDRTHRATQRRLYGFRPSTGERDI